MAAGEGFDLSRGLGSRTTLSDGTSMPVLGLGVWKAASGRETREAVATALSLGYRLIDTAAMYGNEADVGAAVRASGIPRDEIFVTTKVWNDDQGYEPTLRAFERSARALDLGTIDLYLVHWPVSGKRLETYRALEHLRKTGRCRSIGVANFTVAHLAELGRAFPDPPSVDQVEFSPFLYQRELLETCRATGVQLEAWAPLTRGVKIDHPTLQAIAARHHRTAAQVLIRWGLQHGVVEIPKSVHAARLRENADVFGFALSESDVAKLDSLHEGYRTGWDPSALR